MRGLGADRLVSSLVACRGYRFDHRVDEDACRGGEYLCCRVILAHNIKGQARLRALFAPVEELEEPLRRAIQSRLSYIFAIRVDLNQGFLSLRAHDE